MKIPCISRIEANRSPRSTTPNTIDSTANKYLRSGTNNVMGRIKLCHVNEIVILHQIHSFIFVHKTVGIIQTFALSNAFNEFFNDVHIFTKHSTGCIYFIWSFNHINFWCRQHVWFVFKSISKYLAFDTNCLRCK